MAKQGNSRRDQLNFNGGEISPLLLRRYDLDVFGRGCRQMQNMIPRKYGNAEKRAGTQYIASTKYGSGKSARLVTFSYSTDVVFFLEFGDRYIRFFTDGGIVMKDGVPYEIVSPYDEDTIGDIDWKEINDVVYITHPLIAPKKLARYADDNWTITPIEFDEPPFMALNVTDTTITPSAEYGNCTLTASAPLFDQKHVGSYWKIGVKAASRKSREPITSNGEKPFIRVKGRFTFSTCGTWAATIVIQRAYEAATPVWEDVYTYESAKDKNFETEIEQKDEIALWRVKIENFSGIEGDIPYVTLEAAEEYIYGTAKVLSVTSSTVANVFIYDRMYSSGGATKIWYEGAWSDYRGFPRSCCLFQQRMVYAGTTYQPQSVWGSVIGDYENFAYGTLDDDAFMHEIGSDERLFVMWMTAHNNSLLVGTSSAEYVLQGSNAGDDPVTPSNVQIKRQCSIGSARIRPIQAGGAVLHVQRDTEKLYELTYSLSTYGYDDNDITQFAEHIMRGGVKSMAFQRQPDPIVWVVRNDGVLLSCIYDASQKVVAWARHVTQGIVEDVVVGYGKTAGDEVWLVVTRTLGDGSKGRYIERIYPGDWETKDEGIFVDSALSNTMYEYASVAQPPPGGGGGGGGTGETDEQDEGGKTGGGPDPYYPSEQPDPDNPWVPEDPSERNAPCPATQCRYKALNATLVGVPAFTQPQTPPLLYLSSIISGSRKNVEYHYSECGSTPTSDSTHTYSGGWIKNAMSGAETDNGQEVWECVGSECPPRSYPETFQHVNLWVPSYHEMPYDGVVSITPTEYRWEVVDTSCREVLELSHVWGHYRASGYCSRKLSNPDTESDAEARALAAASAQNWTGPAPDSCQVASFRTDRGNTFSWSATQTQHRAQVPDYNPDNPDAEYEVDLWYVVTEGLMSARWVTEGFHTVTKKPTSPGDNWTEWVDIPIPEVGFFAWHMGCRVRVHNSGS